MQFHPVDHSSGDQHMVAPSCSGVRDQEFDCDDIALKQHKKNRTRPYIDLQTVSEHDGKIYKPHKNKTQLAPCYDDDNFKKAFTTEELNIQLRSDKKFSSRRSKNLKIYDTFMNGCVVVGSIGAVVGLLAEDPEKLKAKTGVIINTSIFPSDDYQFNEYEDFAVEKELGKGSFGVVNFCKHATTEKNFVSKKVFDKFHRKEVDVLMQLHHTNITRFFGFIIDNHEPEILMEYAGKSLKNLVECGDWQIVLTDENILNLSYQGFCGLNYMHNYDILHLDIKPENICITLDPLVLKITDFGSSKTPQQPVSLVGWTPEYMSPEACTLAVIQKMQNVNCTIQLSGKCDVFAFSLTVGFMLCKRHIVQDIVVRYLMTEEDRNDAIKYMEARTKILFYSCNDLNFVKKLAIDDSWPDNIKLFLRNGLEGNAESRWTSAEARDFFSGEMKDVLSLLPTIIDSPPPSSSPNVYSSSISGNSPFFSQLKSSLGTENIWHTGDDAPGKMIRNKLRMKLKQNSRIHPYTVHGKVQSTGHTGPTKEEPDVHVLPDFSLII